MKKITAAAFVLSALASSVALADGNSLSGLYVGGSLGTATATMTFEDYDCYWDCSAYTLGGTNANYGVQVGQNFVSGNLLLGWGLDYNLGSVEKNLTYGNNWGSSRAEYTTEFKSALALRAKVGLVVDKTAVVLTYGPAQGDFDQRVLDKDATAPQPQAHFDDSMTGVVTGVGIEHAFSDRLIVGADLSKYTFESEMATWKNNTPTNNPYRAGFVNSLETFHVSANFKF